MLINKQTDKFKEWEKYINKCFHKLDKNFLAMLNISKDVLESEQELNKFLKAQGLNWTERKEILKIYKFSQKRKKQNNLILNALNNLEKDIPKDNEAKAHRAVQRIYSDSKRIKSLLFKNLMGIQSAVVVKNKIWAMSLAKELINMGPHRLFFELQDLNLTDEKKKSIEKKILSILKNTQELLGDSLLGKMLPARLERVEDRFGEKVFIAELSAEWSLTEIRAILPSRTFGKRFSGFWFWELLNRTSDAEVNAFLDKSLTIRELKKMPLESFWIFRHFVPADDVRREVIFKKLMKINKRSDPYLQYLLVSLLENNIIKRGMIKRNQKFNRALFKIERDLYRELLSKGEAINFALYNLILLGDKDDRNLWWLAL